MRNNLTPLEDQIVSLAMGRIFRMGARPTQPGDLAEYHRCRAIILDICEEDGLQWEHTKIVDIGGRPNWVRDRLKGAQGD